MIPVIFYEKPFCINNTKQKEKLKEFGFNVICINLLETKFSKNQLLDFFNGKNIKDYINKNAPAIKNNEIDIKNLSDEDILKIIISDPILIKRPLITIGSNKFCGFDLNKLLKIKLEEIK